MYHINNPVIITNVVNDPVYFVPVGTKYYRMNVTDRRNRYLQIPWQEDSTIWIETNPIELDINITEDKLNDYKQFFDKNKCHYSISELVQQKKPSNITNVYSNNFMDVVREGFTHIVSNNKPFSYENVFKDLKNLKDLKDDTSNTAKSYSLLRDGDAVYDFKGIKSIKVLDLIKMNEKEFKPDFFTINNPLHILTYYNYIVELDNNNGCFSHKNILYPLDTKNEIRRKNMYVCENEVGEFKCKRTKLET